MLIVDWPQFLKNGLPLEQKKSSMTVGVFDGVHRGHQALIQRIVSRNDAVPVVVTFRENYKCTGIDSRGGAERQRRREEGEGEKKEIYSFQEKVDILESLGIKIVVVIDFTDEFRHMRGMEFLEILLEHGCIGFLAVGSSFCCGYKLDTDANAIADFFASRGIPIEIMPEVMEGGLPISSSRIRSAIACGDFELAQVMLGRKFDVAEKQ